MSSADLLAALLEISKIAPDLIRTEPRHPLYNGGPEYGPLLFWSKGLAGPAALHSCLACQDTAEPMRLSESHARILPGLLVCCDYLGWGSEVMTDEHEFKARVTRPTAFHPARGTTRTHALALALLSALRADQEASA